MPPRWSARWLPRLGPLGSSSSSSFCTGRTAGSVGNAVSFTAKPPDVVGVDVDANETERRKWPSGRVNADGFALQQLPWRGPNWGAHHTLMSSNVNSKTLWYERRGRRDKVLRPGRKFARVVMTLASGQKSLPFCARVGWPPQKMPPA